MLQLQTPVCVVWLLLFFFSLFLSHFNGDLHFKATVQPKPIFNTTLRRFRLRWDCSNACNHSGLSQTEPTRPAHCSTMEVLYWKVNKNNGRETCLRTAHGFIHTCSLQFVITPVFFWLFFTSTVASEPRSTSCISLKFPQPPERTCDPEACRTVDVLAENMKVVLCLRVKLYCWVFQALGTTEQQQEPDLFCCSPTSMVTDVAHTSLHCLPGSGHWENFSWLCGWEFIPWVLF